MQHVLIMLAIFLVLVLLKVPIAYAMGASAFFTIFRLGINPITAINSMFASVNTYSMLAVPLFMLLGQLMNYGGITERLEKFCRAVIGHVRGGLGYVNVLESMLFAGLSGSAIADTAGIGAVMIPTMKRAGYDAPYSVAITCCSSTLGVIIPPSVLMVVYGAMGGVSIGALFAAGIIPGILIGGFQMIYTYQRAKKYDYPVEKKSTPKEAAVATWKAIPVLVIPLVILGGTTSGLFTATESAAVACFVTIVLMFVVYRHYNLKSIPGLLIKTAEDVSLGMFAVACAGIIAWLIAYLGAADQIVAALLKVSTSRFWIYGFLTVFLLILGTFLSPMTAILVFMPIYQRLASAGGINPVHMGIIVNLLLSIGMVTPPYGSCLLLATRIGEIELTESSKACLPIIGVTLIAIWIGIIFPDIFFFLPKMMMPTAFAG